MTTLSVHRQACDAPHCQADRVVDKVTDILPGWTRLSSFAHLRDWVPGRLPGRNGRTRRDTRTRWDVWSGAFDLHLCPVHGEVFAEHIPATEGGPASRGERRIQVSCSCTWRTSVKDYHLVAGPSDAMRGPRHRPHNAWWRHLPPELQEYAERGRAEEAA